MADVRLLTLQERCQIEELLKTGISISEVARRIGRSKNAVVTEVRVNGGIAKYTAQGAQKSAYERQVLGRQKLHDLNIGQKRPTDWKTRLENLEMQVEILLDALMEKHV